MFVCVFFFVFVFVDFHDYLHCILLFYTAVHCTEPNKIFSLHWIVFLLITTDFVRNLQAVEM